MRHRRQDTRYLRGISPASRINTGYTDTMSSPFTPRGIAAAINQLVAEVFTHNRKVGWWDGTTFGPPESVEPGKLPIPDKWVIPTKLDLAHSELSEALEGFRKNLMDDHLPHRPMLAVELADAAIRIFDIAGAMGYDLGTIIIEKREYNAIRADHTREARAAEGGKSV